MAHRRERTVLLWGRAGDRVCIPKQQWQGPEVLGYPSSVSSDSVGFVALSMCHCSRVPQIFILEIWLWQHYSGLMGEDSCLNSVLFLLLLLLYLWWALWFLKSQPLWGHEHSYSFRCFSRNSLIKGQKYTVADTKNNNNNNMPGYLLKTLFLSSHLVL